MLGLLSGTVRSAPNPTRKTLLCTLPSETQADSGLRVTRQPYLVIQGLSRQVSSLDPFGNGWFEALIAPRLADISPDRELCFIVEERKAKSVFMWLGWSFNQ